MAGAGILTILALLLVGVPIAALSDAVRLWRWWHHQPLQSKYQMRSGGGAFAVVLAIGLAIKRVPAGDPVELYAIGSLGAIGLLYLVAGVAGARGATYDWFSLAWWAIGAAACIALVAFKGIV